jgi:hypothetical protein
MRAWVGSLALAIVMTSAAARADEAPAAAAENVEAPPPAPYAKGLVVDTAIGAIGFLGKFNKVAPPGPWFHAQVGYEFFNWLMLYGEGELSFTDTSNTDAPPAVRSFAMFGFGGGVRFTWRITNRIGIYGQPGVGMLKADTPKNTLGLHGFSDAESLNVWGGLRAGFEWYQIDRHLALGLSTGVRLATGFQTTGRASDSPLAIDGGVSLRYAF